LRGSRKRAIRGSARPSLRRFREPAAAERVVWPAARGATELQRPIGHAEAAGGVLQISIGFTQTPAGSRCPPRPCQSLHADTG
jgi:hypothetical protein